MLRRDNIKLIAVATVCLIVGVSAPAVGHGVQHALFAHNADKIDGKHAVGAAASTNTRKGKLIATRGTTGQLPNNIIAKAPDANNLDGHDGSAFARHGEVHVITESSPWVSNLANTDITHFGDTSLIRRRPGSNQFNASAAMRLTSPVQLYGRGTQIEKVEFCMREAGGVLFHFRALARQQQDDAFGDLKVVVEDATDRSDTQCVTHVLDDPYQIQPTDAVYVRADISNLSTDSVGLFLGRVTTTYRTVS